MTDEEILRALRRAAEWAAYSWPGVIDPDDLTQELAVWYLTSPAVRKKFAGVTSEEVSKLAARQAHVIAAEARRANARFSADVEYSVDEVKAALAQGRVYRELGDDIAAGLATLKDRNAAYFEALVSLRTAESEADRKRYDRAVKALTDDMNAAVRRKFDRLGAGAPEGVDIYEASENGGQYRTSGDGPGTKRRVFPEVDNSRSLFDPEMRGMPGLDMYRAWVFPDEYPEERQPVLTNWSAEDVEDTWQQ